ncbi:MAG TPA: HAD-IIB family hydrolase [Candidatus Latescibacteria bacterium]|nr:HAD-IIB family hydrolase [Candidatus Latescibacterota bacterium]
MAIRLVAIDIDRTLLNDRRELSPANERALRDLVERGISVALCSGRDLPSTQAISAPLGLPLWLVVQNGSLVIDPSGNAAYLCSMEKPTALAVLDILERHGLAPVVYEVYPRAHCLWWQTGARAAPGMIEFRTQHGAQVSHVEDIRSVLTPEVSHLEVFDDADRVVCAGQDFATLDEVVAITNMSSSVVGSALMGLYPRGTAKEEALARVCDVLRISRTEVLAIGDNLNDVGMVRWAGIGVMMANGPEEARLEADWVAPSNNENGVAVAVERFTK